MAYRKVDEASLTAVANSIRAKGGTTGALAFPNGFVSAVQAIQAGGSGNQPEVGFVPTAWDADGYITEGTWHGATVPDKYFLFNNYSITKLEKIRIDKNTNKCGSEAFENNTSLKTVEFENETFGAGVQAFRGCTSLVMERIPKGYYYWGHGTQAFMNCTSLKNITVPSNGDSRYAIPLGCFENCTGLESVTFEGTFGTVGSNAFNGCTNLLTINVPWAEGAVANAPWGATNATINYNYTGV